MKILMTFLTFGKNIFGGIENSIYNLALGLIKNGHEVVIYTGSLHNEGSEIDGIKVYYSKYLKNSFDEPVEQIDSNIIKNYDIHKSKIESEFLSIIQKEKPSYILSIDSLWGIVSFLDIFNYLKCPVGLVYHMAYDKKLIEMTLRCPYDHFFFVSEYLHTKIEHMLNGFNRKYYILPNSINTKLFKQGSVSMNVSEEIIFCNSRIASEKGVEYLVESFIKINSLRPNLKLFLCSGKFHFGRNKQIIQNIKNNISDFALKDRIVFLPELKWHEVPVYLNKAKLVVLPTRDETFGIAALESLASGTPLIASRVGNLPNLIQDSGVLIDYSDVESLSEAILYVISNDEFYLRMKTRGLEISKKYDYQIVGNDFIEIIGEKNE